MAFKNAQSSRVIVGQVAFSGYTRNVSIDSTTDMLDVTVLSDTAKAFIPGQDTSTMSLSMVLDTDTTDNGQVDRLVDWKAASAVPVTYGPAGLAALSEVFLVNALESSVSASSQASGTVDAELSAQTDGQTDFGYSLEDLSAVTSDTNGTARDLTASSSAGGVAHLHVTAFSGFTSDAITIEHSVDGSTSWATLVTFTTVTGLTSERVVVASGTTIRRHLRVVDDVTGTGSITRQVSFARR